MLFILSVVVAIIAFFAWRGAARKVKENNLSFRSLANISVLGLVVFGLLALSQFFTQVPAGHVGVVDFFGIVSERTLPPGINMVNPVGNMNAQDNMFGQRHRNLLFMISQA